MYEQENLPPRRYRRRLKKSVKRALIAIVAFIVLLIVRPWNMFGGDKKDGQTDEKETNQTEQKSPDTVQTSLNHIVQNADSDIPEADKFDKAVYQFMRQWDVVGASLAIMKDGNLIYSKGYGYASLADSIPMEVKHIMRVASVSKLITAVGIMKLIEDGKFSLNSRVFGKQGLLPQFNKYNDKKIDKITVDNLLRHQGGFSIRSGDPMFDAAKMGISLPVTEDKMIAYVLSNGIRYTPGTRYAYSNVGYLILSKIIEQVTGLSYESYIKEAILNPIGCYDMHIGHNLHTQRHDNEVYYYEPKDSEHIPAASGSGKLLPKSNGGNNIELLSGAGGWVASPVELLKFVSAIDYRNSHSTILSRKSIQIMTERQKGKMPIGWINVNDKGDWWRSGSMAGTSAMLRRQSNGYTWIFVTNTSSWKGSRLAPMINSMLQKAFKKVTEWPDKDLFQLENEESAE